MCDKIKFLCSQRPKLDKNPLMLAVMTVPPPAIERLKPVEFNCDVTCRFSVDIRVAST